MQYGKHRAYCCPRIVDRFLKLERKFVPYIVTADSSGPATRRWDDTQAQASENRRDPTKSKIENKNKDNNQATSNRLRDLPDWLKTENLEETEVPASSDTPTNTSQDSDSERLSKMVLRKYSIYNTHFPKDRNCKICKHKSGTQEAQFFYATVCEIFPSGWSS